MTTTETTKKNLRMICAEINLLRAHNDNEDLKNAYQHLVAAIDYLNRGRGEQANRRIECAHGLIARACKIRNMETATIRRYHRATILGEGDKNRALLAVIKEMKA